MNKVSLRSRIIIVLAVIVTVTSVLFAGGVILLKAKLEEVIFANMAQVQLQTLSSELELGSYDRDHLFTNWQLIYGEDVQHLDPLISNLPAGSHHSVKVKDQYYQIEVGELDNSPIYLLYNITEWEEQEHQLLEWLAYGIGVLILVALLMGSQASKTILSPVRALSAKLSAFDPSDRGVRIGQEFQGNEVGQIANAFDRYLERLDKFVDREQSFTAASSHELRTPLSVMIGAVEVLETRELDTVSQRALARIKRASGEMLAFVEATLFLSREGSSTITAEKDADVEEIIDTLLEDYSPLISQHGLEIKRDYQHHLTLEQPESIVKITIGNILRNAIEHTHQGGILIILQKDCISIKDTGSGIPAEDLPYIYDRSYSTKSGGIGMGLNLVKRICDRFNWKLDISSIAEQGTTVQIIFQE